jgi:hypothetical protein
MFHCNTASVDLHQIQALDRLTEESIWDERGKKEEEGKKDIMKWKIKENEER